ncbi:hypothetical protein [Methylobacterium sp. JK268]
MTEAELPDSQAPDGGAPAHRSRPRPPVPSLAMAGRVLIVALALAIPLAAAPMADHLRPAAALHGEGR